MKIYTRVEYGWDAAQQRYVVLFAKHFDYTGPVARCDEGGGGVDTSGDSGDTGSSDKGGDSGGDNTDAYHGTDAPQDAPTPDGSPPADLPSGDTPSKIPDVVKGAGDVAAKTLAQAGVLAGVQAVSNRNASSQADAFNKQLSGLVSNANSQSYNNAQAVPLTPTTPGLSGSTGTPRSPAATVANMNLPAPVSSTSNTTAGTQVAPNSPPGGGQTGAIKLGVRPQVYA